MPCTLECETDMGWFQMHPNCHYHNVRETYPLSNTITITRNQSVTVEAERYYPAMFTCFRCYFFRYDRREEPIYIPCDLCRQDFVACTRIVFDASITDQRQVRVTITATMRNGSSEEIFNEIVGDA